MERLTKRIGVFVYYTKGKYEDTLPAECETQDVRDILSCLAAYEDIGLEPQEIERIVDAYGRGLSLRTESAQRLEMIREIPDDRLREIVEADRDGRCVVLPKDGMVYYIEETGGEKWIANKPIQQITVKCGWGIASLEFSLFDTGKYFTREATEAALKGEQDG